MRRRSRAAAIALSATLAPPFLPTQAVGRQPLGGLANPSVGAFGQHDSFLRAPRALVQAPAEAHRANFLRSASWTAGCTRADTSPPKRATSRTRLELR